MAKARKSILSSLGRYQHQHDKQQCPNGPLIWLVTLSTYIDGESSPYQDDPSSRLGSRLTHLKQTEPIIIGGK